MSAPKGFQDKVALVWAVADLLRGDFKPHEYGSVILPFVVLRRLECALEDTKDKVIAKDKSLGNKIKDKESILCSVSGHTFYNTSPYNLSKILADTKKIASNLNSYIYSFSPSASEVLEKYGFPEKIKRLDESQLLYLIVGKFADLDLSEKTVSNEAMGYIFEELLRKFSEMSNETAGEHYTPREVIRLMVNLLFIEDQESLSGQKPIRSIYDPACGTGGMLSIAEEHLHMMNPNIVLNVFGQELNAETWAIARSDLMIKGQDPKRITQGNSLTDEDGHAGTHFDYCISNPPYGVDWKKYQQKIKDEAANLGFRGRYGAGLPPVDDGSFLFVQHMISKMKKYNSKDGEGGSRIAVILSGTPMYAGQAGGGESEIRRWILDNDLLEAVIALPDQMFYNTPIGTYIWIITNRKTNNLKDKIKFIDARNQWVKRRKALGDKRKDIPDSAISVITCLYEDLNAGIETEASRLMDKSQFYYQRITIERPLKVKWKSAHLKQNKKIDIEIRIPNIGKEYETEDEILKDLIAWAIDKKYHKEIVKQFVYRDESSEPQRDSSGNLVPDSNLRDQENIQLPKGFLYLQPEEQSEALQTSANEHLEKEIHNYLPESWIDHDKSKIGVEIAFTRQFFVPQEMANLNDIQKKISYQNSKWNDLIAELL